LGVNNDTQEPPLPLTPKLSQAGEESVLLDVWDEADKTTTIHVQKSIYPERLQHVDQYLDNQENHLPFLPARPSWMHRPDVEPELEVDIPLDAAHSNHRVDHLRGLPQKLNSQIEEMPIQDSSFIDDVLVRPVSAGLSLELPISQDIIDPELGIEHDLERGIRTHSNIHNTEQSLHGSNFAAAYQSP
jgi:hypothetical protein